MLVSFFVGPSFPAQQTLAEKKLAQSRTKLSNEEQATLMYMMYQQQHFLNNQIEESKDRVLAECKVPIQYTPITLLYTLNLMF